MFSCKTYYLNIAKWLYIFSDRSTFLFKSSLISYLFSFHICMIFVVNSSFNSCFRSSIILLFSLICLVCTRDFVKWILYLYFFEYVLWFVALLIISVLFGWVVANSQFCLCGSFCSGSVLSERSQNYWRSSVVYIRLFLLVYIRSDRSKT